MRARLPITRTKRNGSSTPAGGCTGSGSTRPSAANLFSMWDIVTSLSVSTSTTRGRQTCSAGPSLRHHLRRVVEEGLAGDPLAVPALVGEFLHAGRRAVEPLELEHPAQHRAIAVHEDRPHAGRAHRAGACQH